MSPELFHRKSGSGPNLIILHGLYGSSDNWLTIARKLETHFTVWVPDQRNHGQSPHAQSHTYNDMKQDLFHFFQMHQIEKASVMGHSMGGKVAMHFAADYPEMVEQLIVVDISPKAYAAEGMAYQHVKQHQLILEIVTGIDLSAVSSRTEIDHYFAEKFDDTGLRLFLLKNIHRSKAGIFEWKMNVPILKEAIWSIVNDVNESWFADRIPITAYPVTFIRGLKSDYISDNDIAPILSIYPGARIVDIPDAGHWLHAEQPAAFLKAIQNLDIR